jgi:hypothetical protein
MVGELEWMRKETLVMQFEILFWRLSGGIGESNENFGMYSWSPGRELKQRPSE